MIKFIQYSLLLIFLATGKAMAVDSSPDNDNTNQLKAEIAGYLTDADIAPSTISTNQELQLAEAEMGLAKEYLNQGYKNDAIIFAVQARRTLQNIYTNPYDPKLIPVYSLLVQVYSSDYDAFNPGTNASNDEQAKKYREMISHIHAE